eukprot:6429032-Amphidinium_carterae.1
MNHDTNPSQRLASPLRFAIPVLPHRLHDCFNRHVASSCPWMLEAGLFFFIERFLSLWVPAA